MWSESREGRADAIQSAFMYYKEVQIFHSGKSIKYLSKVILQCEDLPKIVMREYFSPFLTLCEFLFLHKCYVTQMLKRRMAEIQKTRSLHRAIVFLLLR